jgi:hypothetical protein
MRFPAFLLLLVCFLISFSAGAQVKPGEKQPRILILLDGSSSMLQPWVGNEIRFKAAANIITKLIDSIYKVNDQVEFALRVYGHQSPAQNKNCIDTKREVMFSKDNLTQIALRLESLHPIGVSPIAFSLREAAENEMADGRNYNYSLVLITDGGESCGGNICEVAKKLLEMKISFKPYIIGLVDYAPLKDQYECLGEYLTVTKEQDIPVTVGKIVEAYKPMITMASIDPKLLQTAIVNAPSALKVTIPKVKVQTEPETKPVAKPVEKPKEEPKKEPVPQVIPPQVTPPPAKDLTSKIVIEETPARPKNEIVKMNPGGFRILPNMVTTEAMRTVRVPPRPVYRPDVETSVTPPVAAAPKPIVKPTPKIAAPPKPKEAKYTIQREEAKETTLEIYFTDGKGKFYQTTPQIILTDPQTNQQKHKFYRMVNATGNPDPQNIPVGTYDLTITGKANLLVHNIEIKPNSKNKYLIQVNKASILFSYEGNPKRPVSEYTAIVNRRFEPGPTIKQACTQELEYDPGTYYIEVNTKPVFKRNFDLDFGTQYNIFIPEDGFLNITNTNNLGKVDLYCPLGDVFVKFDQVLVNSSSGGQKLVLQPGTYEARYNRTPGSDQTIMKFRIFSNKTTDLQLD